MRSFFLGILLTPSGNACGERPDPICFNVNKLSESSVGLRVGVPSTRKHQKKQSSGQVLTLCCPGRGSFRRTHSLHCNFRALEVQIEQERKSPPEARDSICLPQTLLCTGFLQCSGFTAEDTWTRGLRLHGFFLKAVTGKK